MAILAECPRCRKKQSARNRLCSCGEDLVNAKKSQRVRYWISYRLPGGKQRREPVGFSIEEARDADGKRRSQKREGRIFDMLPESKMTFKEVSGWYLGLETVQGKASYRQMCIRAANFNQVFGATLVGEILPTDLEDYQLKRRKQGRSDSYIDDELGQVKSMIKKAFDAGSLRGDALRPFSTVKKLLRRHANARDRVLTIGEYKALLGHSPNHLRPVLMAGFWTGMRLSEVLGLTWNKLDIKNGLIRLEAEDTKDREPRTIQISDELLETLKSLPKGLYDNHVFLYQGKPIVSIRKALQTTCEKAGIEYGRNKRNGFTYHDLRHTFNTLMRKSGIPESVIMKITGHSTREMFDRYNTVDLEDAREALSVPG
jgi:integrase